MNKFENFLMLAVTIIGPLTVLAMIWFLFKALDSLGFCSNGRPFWVEKNHHYVCPDGSVHFYGDI